ncbi:MAG: hypothetical protein C4523_20460 [Myxococcales bacterium]|nr:MAG: hypothetical protein C4523_20460 [Myxococcales bacterium]
MKLWKLALALLLVAASAACTVEENDGIWIETMLTCEPESDTGQTHGLYDTLVAELLAPHDGYWAHPKIANQRAVVSDGKLQGDNSVIRMTHFQVEYEVPIDWDPIESIRIPFSYALQGGSEISTYINVMPPEVRLAIEANYAKNAYKNLQPAATARPNVAGQACAHETAAAVCLGYPCITESGEPTQEIGESGECGDYCGLFRDCATGYRCDTGVGPFGICRQACEDSSADCQPLTNANGEVLVTYECNRSRCVPAGATVNPNDAEPLYARITAYGDDVGGGEISTQTFKYAIYVCRGCLLFFGDYCDNTPQNPDGQQTWENDLEFTCGNFRQDTGVQCAWIADCYKQLCFSE